MANPQIKHDSPDFQKKADQMFRLFDGVRGSLERAQQLAKELASAFKPGDVLWERFKSLEELTELMLATSAEGASIQDMLYEFVDFVGVFNRAAAARPANQLVYNHCIDEAMRASDQKQFDKGRPNHPQDMVIGIKNALGAWPFHPTHDEYHKVADKLADTWNDQQQRFEEKQKPIASYGDDACTIPDQEVVYVLKDKKQRFGTVELLRIHKCGQSDIYEAVHRPLEGEPLRLNFTQTINGKKESRVFTDFEALVIAVSAYIQHLEGK